MGGEGSELYSMNTRLLSTPWFSQRKSRKSVKPSGYSVAGVDVSTCAIVAAKAKAEERKLKIDFRLANALSLEFQSGRFDNAIDSGLFHTFTDNDRISFAHEIARVLTRNGGYFMLF